MSWKEWDQGEVVEAGDFQTYIQNQVVQRYANASERTTVLGTAVEEGMVSYREDANVVEVYDGSSWVDFTGDITQITAGTALTGGGTAGDVTLDVDISALATAQAGTALTASGETLNVDETELFTGGTAGYTALSNGTAGLSYQPVSHNYIINGAFDIWQRGTSFTNVSSNTFYADRWRLNYNGTGVDIDASQIAFTPADITAIGYGEGEFYQRITLNTVGSGQTYYHVDTRLEDARMLAGQDVTVSFWARSDAAGATAQVRILQQFGSGGSTTATVVGSNVSLTSSWVRYSATLTLPSISGKTIGASSNLRITIQNNNPATGDYDIWGVQLEAGSVATPFKRHAPSLQGELAACQRYYQRQSASAIQSGSPIAFGFATSTTSAKFKTNVLVDMRAQPSISFSSNTGFRVWDGVNAASSTTAMSVTSNTYDGFGNVEITATVSSGLTQYRPYTLIPQNAQAAYIELSAEL